MKKSERAVEPGKRTAMLLGHRVTLMLVMR